MPLACLLNRLIINSNIAKRCPYIKSIENIDTPSTRNFALIYNWCERRFVRLGFTVRRGPRRTRNGNLPDGMTFRPYGALVEEDAASGVRVIMEAVVAGNGII